MKKLLFTLITVLCLTVAAKAQSINSALTANGAPENLEATIVNDSLVLLTWSPVEGALGYGILLYGEPLGLTSYADTSAYIDQIVPGVEFCFTVVAILQINENNYPTEISDQSEIACVTTGTLSVEELEYSLNIYPNPVKDELFLATEVNVKEIEIYDVYGRMTKVYGLQTTDFVHSIDVADLNSGIYFVKVVTSEGEVVKRFVKK